MSKLKHSHAIALLQGEVRFTGRNASIRTVLGSCVAITMWHPHLLLGGMCHYMLPSRRAALHERRQHSSGGVATLPVADFTALDGKYADEALELMMSEIGRKGTRVSEYQVKLFGGGNMFPVTDQGGLMPVGQKNIRAGHELLARHGLKVSARHLGGHGHRNLIFDVDSGDVWLRYQTHTAGLHDNGGAGDVCLHA
jgi:chemotaxis protein CheD